MPPEHHHPHHHNHHGVHQEPPKPNQRFLALILKALIMIFITSLFFLFVGVAAILFLFFLACGALHRRRRHHHHRPRSSSFSSRDLRRLPQFRFASGTTTTAAAVSDCGCVVCLDAFRDGQWCRRLGACGHVFHRRCLDAWLVKTPACPICRTRVRLDLGDRASTSSRDFEEEAKRWWGFERTVDFRAW